ncbi:MAG: ABC transporter ATP-binding protein [Eubacteriales bacterium]
MLIEVKELTKIYKGKGRKTSPVVANDNISLVLKEGEVLGLLGHNGAGKTTLVNQIVGLLSPTKGDISLMGESVTDDPKRARFMCSVQPQAQVPLLNLTPAKAVTLMGKMRGGSEEEVNKRMGSLFKSLDIEQWAKTPGYKLSGGMKRLTAFCMAVVRPGKVVILDEPTNDIDPVRRRYLWNEIRNLTKGGTSVILVTHNVLEAEKAVDRVAILHKGKLLAEGTPSEVKQTVKSQLRFEVNLAVGTEDIDTPSWAISERKGKGRKTFSLEASSVTEAIKWAQVQTEEGNILDYTLSPTTLEDVYIKLTGGKTIEDEDVVDDKLQQDKIGGAR